MSEDFRQLTDILKGLIGQLKQRCLEAEARVEDLERRVAEQQARISELEAENEALDTKYRNLQSGLAATGNDPERVAQLKEMYLALVSEIDACIVTLQHGQKNTN